MDRIASNYTHRPIENQGTAVAESGVNCPASPIDVNRDEKQSEENGVLKLGLFVVVYSSLLLLAFSWYVTPTGSF
jgi:hypothetical protein